MLHKIIVLPGKCAIALFACFVDIHPQSSLHDCSIRVPIVMMLSNVLVWQLTVLWH